ncbi:hypothetical protein ACWKSP_26170 [Micromonosporaceae bacterium Da 78-11]
MTGWLLWGVAIVVACLFGEFWFRLRMAAEFTRGVLAGQRQAEMCSGRRVTEVNVGHAGDESWALVDKQQHRSPAQPEALNL